MTNKQNNMNILLQAVQTRADIVFFDDNRHIVDSVSINISSQETKSLAPFLDELFQKKCGGISQIRRIVVVVGPGSFTAIRAIVLTINTLAFIYPHILLTSISFFDLFLVYPIVKSSSKKDVFCKFALHDEVEILKNEEFLQRCIQQKIDTVYGECSELSQDLKFVNTPTYDTIITDLVFLDQKVLEPLYIKKPSIS